jgi:integrase
MAGSIQKTVGVRGTAYLVRVEFPPDPVTAKRRQRSKSFKTKKEAEKALAAWLVEIERGTVIEPSKLSMGEMLGQWFAVHRADLRPSSIALYETMLRRHIIPGIGSVPALKLAPQHLTAFYAEKRQRGKVNGTGGLSSRSVRILHNITREALDWAVKQQILARNVADAIDAPKFSYKEKRVWTADEARRLLDAATDHEWGPLYLVLLTTGMRRGECLGARWRDLDWQAGKLRIAQQVTAVRGQIVIGEPKTAKARRSVTLAPSCLAALKEHRASQLEGRLKAPEWHDHDLIFCTSHGKPIHPRNIGRTLDRLCQVAGVPRLSVHQTRHTHTTLLFRDGQNIKMISERLGHSSVSVTLEVYAHLAENAQDAAAAAMDRLLCPPDQQSESAAG